MGLTVGSNQDTFNYKVVSQFALVTVLWGIVGMLVGVILAAQLIWPEITFNIPWLSYGRLRPLHTKRQCYGSQNNDSLPTPKSKSS